MPWISQIWLEDGNIIPIRVLIFQIGLAGSTNIIDVKKYGTLSFLLMHLEQGVAMKPQWTDRRSS